MSVQWVLLPVFVLVGLTFALLLGMVGARRDALVADNRSRDSAPASRTGRARRAIGNCFNNSSRCRCCSTS